MAAVPPALEPAFDTKGAIRVSNPQPWLALNAMIAHGSFSLEAITELASEADRLYCEQHPEVQKFVRPRVAGEFPPDYEHSSNRNFTNAGMEPIATMVTVFQPGVRTRVPMGMSSTIPSNPNAVRLEGDDG